MSRQAGVIEVLLRLQETIMNLESKETKLSETDTRQGLINPLFRSLGWDFTNFFSVKSEVRHKNFNEPVDYAFYAAEKEENPILLLEAKKFGEDLGHKECVKQVCEYMGEFGVQWGVLSDGNKYVLYNSRGGDSFDDKRFLTLNLSTANTEDGIPVAELADKLIGLLSRECLENEEIQKAYEDHICNQQIQRAMSSLLSRPFDTLVSAIKREFKEDRVKANRNPKVTKAVIEEYLSSIADEEGRIAVELEAEQVHSDEEVIGSAAHADNTGAEDKSVRSTGKRVLISDLLETGLVEEGDNWKFVYKGEVSWGRVVGNGQLEVNGTLHPNPSRAAKDLVSFGANG